MTRVIVSPISGFCFGVKRALGIAEKLLKEHREVYSLGPIIHNPQVVDEFSKRGLKIIKNLDSCRLNNATVLIPSHGVDPQLLKSKKMRFVDTTCPLVSRVRYLVKSLRKKGYFIIILGNAEHPEVKGLRGVAGKKFCMVVKDEKETRGIRPNFKRVALIAQTTSPLSLFKNAVIEIAKKDFAEMISFNTICRNTIERTSTAERIAGRVEAMIVIGGRQSANTSKLARACKAINKNTYHVECKNDLQKGFLKGKNVIGIATGASTPPYAIREVINRIKEKDAETVRGWL